MMVNTLLDENASSILVVRPGALGDTILAVPLVESIRGAFPGVPITWLGTGRYDSLVPPGVQFEALDDPGWLWLFGSESEPIPERVQVFHQAYVILNKPDLVIRNLRRAGTGEIRHVSSTPRADGHMVEHFHLGLRLPVPLRKPALGYLSSERKQDLIWVHPGSGGPRKCIAPQTMARIVSAIRDTTGWPVAVTAGEEDAFVKNDPGWKALTAKPGIRLLDCRPLSEVCLELAPARIFLGNDCGISHLAAGLGIPCIVFFSATNPAQWAPWTDENLLMISDLRKEEMEPQLQDILQWVADLSRKSGGSQAAGHKQNNGQSP